MTKAETQGIAALIVIALPIYGAMKLGESVGWVSIVAIVASVVGVIIFVRAVQKKQRRESLMAKYKDEDLVLALMNRSFWQGQTAEQLVDSLGRPHSVD
ncbi:hypothetical protein [uncultured Alcanivorax sp.]|uniref:hypothetical protein n=1 Tax=Alcanivorax sp. IL2 TaxID=3396310 RepID=UPI002625F2EB|nr:hypothetical protein [uncultured Alcanivorax sp.]